MFGAFYDEKLDLIYLIGGANSHTYEKINWVSSFCLQSQKWEFLPNLNANRMGPGCVKMSEWLYVFGDEQNSCERFDTTAGDRPWEILFLDIPQQLKYGGLMILQNSGPDDTFFIFGGGENIFSYQNEKLEKCGPETQYDNFYSQPVYF